MITLLKRLFVEHWQRKLISLVLAMIIWMVVNHSMTVTKTVSGVSVRVINLPVGKTIEGMLGNGTLNNKIQLTFSGNKAGIEEINHKNIEVVIDASGQPDQWIANVTKKNLVCTHPEINLSKEILRLAPQEMIIKQSKLVTEKIPILITQPIGEAPKGYQYLGVWPDHLSLTIGGPEEEIRRLKNRGVKLTFNLNDITRAELDTLQSSKDEISFYIPNSWKKISIPDLSDTPLEINDPQAKALRVDFSRQDLLPIGTPIPVTVFFPPKFSNTLNSETYSIALNDFIVKKNGIKMIAPTLYAQGVSRLFLETVKDMIQVVVIASPKSERESLMWNAQFMNPHKLEDRYVAKVLSEASDEASDVQPHMREDYFRNRFRSYMNRFRLYTASNKKLSLKIELQANTISVTPQNTQ